MIIMAVKIDDRQFKQKLEKKGAYSFGKGYQDREGPKRDKYGMVPMEIDATEKCKPFKKKTQKCYNCGKVGHLAKNCKSKKQVNATQGDKRKKKKSQKKEKELNATQIKKKPDHATLSKTACYNDSCLIHLSKKQSSRWFSGSKGQLCATHHCEKELKKHLQQCIDTLQEQMKKLEEQYPSPRKAKIEWEEKSLISSFVLKSKPFDIKDLVPLQPKLH